MGETPNDNHPGTEVTAAEPAKVQPTQPFWMNRQLRRERIIAFCKKENIKLNPASIEEIAALELGNADDLREAIINEAHIQEIKEKILACENWVNRYRLIQLTGFLIADALEPMITTAKRALGSILFTTYSNTENNFSLIADFIVFVMPLLVDSVLTVVTRKLVNEKAAIIKLLNTANDTGNTKGRIFFDARNKRYNNDKALDSYDILESGETHSNNDPIINTDKEEYTEQIHQYCATDHIILSQENINHILGQLTQSDITSGNIAKRIEHLIKIENIKQKIMQYEENIHNNRKYTFYGSMLTQAIESVIVAIKNLVARLFFTNGSTEQLRINIVADCILVIYPLLTGIVFGLYNMRVRDHKKQISTLLTEEKHEQKRSKEWLDDNKQESDLNEQMFFIARRAKNPTTATGNTEDYLITEANKYNYPISP